MRYKNVAILAGLVMMIGATSAWAALGAHQKITRVLPGRPFGDGRDGAVTISGNTTQSLANSSCAGSAGSTTLSLAGASSFQNNDVVLIHQSRGTGAGQWEINKIASGAGGTSLTLSVGLAYTYTDSGASQAQVWRIPQYTNVTLNGGITWYCPTWDGNVGGMLLFAASGTATINGTITTAARGYERGYLPQYAAATGQRGEGTGGAAGTQTTAANGNGGGGGGSAGGGSNDGGGGGGGGNASAGTSGGTGGASPGGSGGSAAGNGELTSLVYGGGGGAGGMDDAYNGETSGDAPGGRGAGGVIIFANNLICSSGTLSLNGANGSSKANSYGGGGGGGAGGSCLVQCQTATLGTSRITVAAGSGGSRGYNSGGNGGAGSVGRIAVHHAGSIGGSTSPAFANVTDASLIPNVAPNAPANPRCEDLTNPTGLTTATPRFSWTFSDGDAGDTQSAYQILVGTTSADGSIWNSGKVTSSASSNITCGTTLNWGTSYKWKVMTWDNSGLGGSYCTDQSFSLQSPPTAFSLSSPSDGIASSNARQPFAWTASSDPDGQGISYTLQISVDAGFTEPLLRSIAGLDTTSHTLSVGEALPDGTYYWKVIASDSVSTTSSSQTWSLIVDTQVPGVPAITGMDCSLQSGLITHLVGSGENGSTLAFRDGGGLPIAGTTTWDGSGHFVFAPSTPLAKGTRVSLTATDAALNATESRSYVATFEAASDVVMDATVSYPEGTGSSLRLNTANTYRFKLAANPGSQLTVSAWVRKNAAYGPAAAPQLRLSGPGLTTATATLTAGPGVWQQLTVAGTPAQAGIFNLEVITSSTADDAAVWVDSIGVSQ